MLERFVSPGSRRSPTQRGGPVGLPGSGVVGASTVTVRQRSTRTYRLVITGTAFLLAFTLSGCSLFRERMCSRGEHAVKSIEAPETGRTCVRDGAPPPDGYEEYPDGQVPTYLDEDR